ARPAAVDALAGRVATVATHGVSVVARLTRLFDAVAALFARQAYPHTGVGCALLLAGSRATVARALVTVVAGLALIEIEQPVAALGAIHPGAVPALFDLFAIVATAVAARGVLVVAGLARLDDTVAALEARAATARARPVLLHRLAVCSAAGPVERAGVAHFGA